MIRLPPTKIELCSRDLDWHVQRLSLPLRSQGDATLSESNEHETSILLHDMSRLQLHSSPPPLPSAPETPQPAFPSPSSSTPSTHSSLLPSSPPLPVLPTASEQRQQPSEQEYQRASQAPPSTPPLPPPRPLPRSAFRIYEDALPRYIQPQTPLGLPRRGVVLSSNYTAPRPAAAHPRGAPTESRSIPDTIYATPSRSRRGVAPAMQLGGLPQQLPSQQPQGDGAIDDSENASQHAELERRRRIVREQRLGYVAGNTEELDSTPPREGRNRL